MPIYLMVAAGFGSLPDETSAIELETKLIELSEKVTRTLWQQLKMDTKKRLGTD